jgi:hypothetical protein
MAYTVINFKTKKALKEAVAQYATAFISERNESAVRCYQPGLGPDLSNYTGKIALEGPHYPKPHTWYAEAWLENGVVVKVK